MDSVMEQQRRRIHPHKFNLYLGIGSIVMMFAGLTSAYIVAKAHGTWATIIMPWEFYASTAAIVLSSITVHLGVKAFKNREMPKYKMLITATLVLGLLFAALQGVGFWHLFNGGVRMNGTRSESFIYIIPGLHLAHMIGGIFALIIVFFRAFRTRVKVYNATGLEIAAIYWHFVDILWIYLFVFFLANQ